MKRRKREAPYEEKRSDEWPNTGRIKTFVKTAKSH
jgi:hypothetical protein